MVAESDERTKADYRDDLGEMAGIGDRALPDFLPPPDQLVRCPGHGQGDAGAEPDQRRLLPRRSQTLGRAQRMIRALVDECARRHG